VYALNSGLLTFGSARPDGIPHEKDPALCGRDSFEEVRQLPPEDWSPRQHASLVHFIFPNSVIVYHPDYVSHMGIFPTAIDESVFVHTVLTPERPRNDKACAHWERSFELMDSKVFNVEDLFICEQIQLGLAAATGVDFVLGRFEHNVRRFHASIGAALNGTGSPVSLPGKSKELRSELEAGCRDFR
jgi:Ring hydroxylating alpha subunit (catalytic domain)